MKNVSQLPGCCCWDRVEQHSSIHAGAPGGCLQKCPTVSLAAFFTPLPHTGHKVRTPSHRLCLPVSRKLNELPQTSRSERGPGRRWVSLPFPLALQDSLHLTDVQEKSEITGLIKGLLEFGPGGELYSVRAAVTLLRDTKAHYWSRGPHTSAASAHFLKPASNIWLIYRLILCECMSERQSPPERESACVCVCVHASF